MKRLITLVAALLLCACAAKGQARPNISGIVYARFAVSDFCKTRNFYLMISGQAVSCPENERAGAGAIPFNESQFVALVKRDLADRQNLVEEIGLATNDIVALRNYLTSNGISATSQPGAEPSLSVADPEGNRISFHQNAASRPNSEASQKQAFRMIHAGFVVRNRTAMEHFYKDILGFKPYWRGGMKDDQTDWESFQVPDGTDWVEFMVNVPANADKRTLGVMNHIALGVADIHAAQKQLLTNGMKLTEEPKIGRDGKWQLNLYDPDMTRVELMEFTPVEKPCCSEYKGPHPKP